MDYQKKNSVLEPLLILVVIGVLIIYTLGVFSSGNWMWFLSNTTELDLARVVIIDHGERHTFTREDADFEMLAAAVNESLHKFSNTDLVDIGLSDQTLDDYAQDGVLLELYFGRPIEFNTLARAGRPTQLLIPIQGRHADGGYVFRGDNGRWWFGAMRMENPQPLTDALRQLGYSVSVSALIN